MWVRFGNKILDVDRVLVDSSMSTIWIGPSGIDRKIKAWIYTNPKRAKEVFNEFWEAVKKGDTYYEFPDV